MAGFAHSATIPSPLTFQQLECIGVQIFGDSVVTAQEYQKYRDFGRYPNLDTKPPMIRKVNTTPWSRIGHPLMSCWYWVYGPVGLYWVLPLLLAMYIHDDQWSVVDGPPVIPSEAHDFICPGLPKGSPSSVHRLSHEEWAAVYELHRMLMSHQCDTLTGELFTLERINSREACSLPRKIYPPTKDEVERKKLVLYVVVAAGIVMASAIVSEQESSWEIQLICSATRSGGGTALIRHLQNTAPVSLKLCPVRRAVPFYETRGFDWVGESRECMTWFHPSQRHEGASTSRRERMLPCKRAHEVISLISDSESD